MPTATLLPPSAEAAPAVDPLVARLRHYNDFLQEAGLPAWTDTALLAKFETSSFADPARELFGEDDSSCHQLLDYVFENLPAFALPVTMSQRRVPANAARLLAEMLAGIHGKDQLPAIIHGWSPVPLFQVGPAIAVAHFDPTFPFDKFLPADLCIPFWVSMADYRETRADFLAQVADAGSSLGQSPLGAPPSFSDFLTQRGLDLAGSEPLRLLPALLLWLHGVSSLSHTDKNAIDALLDRDGEPLLDWLPEDLRLYAQRILFGARVIRTDLISIDRSLTSRFDEALVRDHQLCPLWVTDRYAVLLTESMLSFRLQDDLSNREGLQAIGVLVRSDQFQAACLSAGHGTVLNFGSGSSSHEPVDVEIALTDFRLDGQSLPDGVLESDNSDKLFRYLLAFGATSRATDVHLEMVGNDSRVRFTIDGVPREVVRLPGSLHGNLTAQVKTNAHIPHDAIGEGRGRFSLAVGTRALDVRVQLIHDHLKRARIVLRLLDKSRSFNDIASLGLSLAEMNQLADAYNAPGGIMFFCGPTGQGKTTTIHTILQELNIPDHITYDLGDPIEYVIPGITQISCTADPAKATRALPTFSEATETLLRMAPMIISIGEVRDPVTAAAAIEASLTGHRVFTTLHAEDVYVGIRRLIGLGVKPFDFAASAKMFICQRLVRRVCSCHETVPMSPDVLGILNEAGVAVPACPPRIARAVGCDKCRKTGYYGLMVVLETLPVTDTIREMIVGYATDKISLAALKEASIKEGYRSLKQNGLSKVLHGQTTLAEIERVLGKAAVPKCSPVAVLAA